MILGGKDRPDCSVPVGSSDHIIASHHDDAIRLIDEREAPFLTKLPDNWTERRRAFGVGRVDRDPICAPYDRKQQDPPPR
jgi:hypothetical protein